MILTLSDFRKFEYCSRGLRKFAADNNLDWDNFLLNGIDSSKLEHIDNEMLRCVLEDKKKGA